MHIKIKEGERGSFWFRIKDRSGRTLAVNPTPGFETEAEAREAAEAILRGKWPKWLPWAVIVKALLIIHALVVHLHYGVG